MSLKEKFENKKFIHNANLYWIVNGKVREEVLMNIPYPTARMHKRALDRSPDYRGIGILVVVSARVKDQGREVLKYKFFNKAELCWVRKRDGYKFDNEECGLAIDHYIETGKEP